MDANTQFDREELLHSLPDYVTGEINDTRLLAGIEAEIQNDPSFRNEYEEVKETLFHLSTAELISPGDAYFNNLSVRINERIYPEHNVTLKERISALWKILIPAFSVIIIAAVLYTYYSNDKVPQQIAETNTLTDKPIENNSDQNNITNIQSDEISGNETADNNTDNKTIITGTRNNLNERAFLNNRSSEVTATISIDQLTALQAIVLNQTRNMERPETAIAENADAEYGSQETDDDLLLMNEEDQDIEDEIMQMTPQQQKEILENLNQKQI